MVLSCSSLERKEHEADQGPDVRNGTSPVPQTGQAPDSADPRHAWHFLDLLVRVQDWLLREVYVPIRVAVLRVGPLPGPRSGASLLSPIRLALLQATPGRDRRGTSSTGLERGAGVNRVGLLALAHQGSMPSE